MRWKDGRKVGAKSVLSGKLTRRTDVHAIANGPTFEHYVITSTEFQYGSHLQIMYPWAVFV